MLDPFWVAHLDHALASFRHRGMISLVSLFIRYQVRRVRIAGPSTSKSRMPLKRLCLEFMSRGGCLQRYPPDPGRSRHLHLTLFVLQGPVGIGVQYVTAHSLSA